MFSTITIVQLLLIYFADGSYVKNCRCGRTLERHIVPRIVGGTAVPFHKYPWLVAVFNKNRLHCGGTLINDRYVLTAGHCVGWAKTADLTVGLGLHNISRPEEGIVVRVKRTILHEEFTSHPLHDTNDIALIELARPVPYLNTVRPVCLPHPNSIHEGTTAVVSGWGRVGPKRLTSDLPMSVKVKVMDRTFCLESLIGDQFTDGMICTYFEGRDSCQGDSGGPLVFKRKTGSYELIGIVSWGIGCGEKGIPSVYTKVTKYLKWIENETPNAVYCAVN